MSIKKIVLPNKEVRWEICDRITGLGDKRVRRRFERRVDAQEFLESLKNRKQDFLNPMSLKTMTDVEGTTFNKEADYWLEKKTSDFSLGYFRSIGPGLKLIRRPYGHYSISKFTPKLLHEFRLYMKLQGLAPATQNRYCDFITRVVAFSFKHQRINLNPTIGYEKAKEIRGDLGFWDENEVGEFLSFANTKYPRGHEKRWIYCAYLMALETGVRARELWGLKLHDFSSTGMKIKISRQVSSGNNFISTKGKDSRFVPYSSGLRSEIEFWLGQEVMEKFPERTLFITASATPIDHDNFSDRIFKKDVEQSGLRMIRFHDLRHTAITLLVKRGVVLPVVQKIAGHKDIKTTMRYVHVLGKDIEDIGLQFSLSVSPDQTLRVLKFV